MQFERPEVKRLLAFEGADVFGELDDETFSCTTAIECLSQVIETLFGDEDKPLGPMDDYAVSIGAYKRNELSASWIQSQAEHSAEALRDNFCDEHGDLDGDDRLSDDNIKELERRMHEVVTWYSTQVKVFSCEHLKSFVLNSTDLLEVVQQLRPEWLTEQS